MIIKTKKEFSDLYNNNQLIDYYINCSMEEKFASADNLAKFFCQLKNDLISLKGQTGWNDFFVPFKKIYTNLYFFASFVNEYTNFLNNNKEKNVENWLRLYPYALDVLSVIDKPENYVVFKQKMEDIISSDCDLDKKEIIKNWLSGFSSDLGKEEGTFNTTLDTIIKKFSKNLSAIWNKNYAIFVPGDKRYKVSGLNKSLLSLGSACAKDMGKDGWLFYVSAGGVDQLLSCAKNRAFRKSVYEAYKKLNTDARVFYSNDQNLRKIILLKQRFAKELYGKESYSDLVFSNYVLNEYDKVSSYLDVVENTMSSVHNNIMEKVVELAKNNGINELKPWDVNYYLDKVKKLEKINGSSDFSNYYNFDVVLKNIFKFIKKEFSINFEVIKKELIDASNVYTYKISDEKIGHSGYFLISPDASSIMSPHQMSMCQYQDFGDGVYAPSVQMIVLDIDKNKKMNFSDVTVLMHEIGHFLHAFYFNKKDQFSVEGMISNDLIELPSIFFENFCYDVDFMQKISSHNVTNQKITKKALKDEIQNNLFSSSYNLYANVKKYKAQIYLHKFYTKETKMSVQEFVDQKISDSAFMFNFNADDCLLSSDHLKDYSASEYVYLYAGNIANKMFRHFKNNIKYVYTDIFNSNFVPIKDILKDHVDLNTVDFDLFLKKGLNVKVAGL